MTIDQYRKRWIRRHKRYEREAYKIFMQSFRTLANNIPFNFINEGNYETILPSSIKQSDIFNAYLEVYNTIGKKEGERVGKQINRELKEWTLNSFLSEFERQLFEWLFRNTTRRMTEVRQTFINYLNKEIAFGLSQGKTISEITTDLQRLINSRNFYRWQALRIARTETTAASNFAATVSADVSDVVTEKLWISADDARTRRTPPNQFDHAIMDGVRVGYNEPFNVQGEELDFPGDPKGSAANVINCRCTVAIVPKRDAQGRIMRTDII